MTIMAMMRDMIMMMVIVMRMRRKNIVINDIQAWTLCPAWKKAGPPCYMVITSDRQIVSNELGISGYLLFCQVFPGISLLSVISKYFRY